MRKLLSVLSVCIACGAGMLSSAQAQDSFPSRAIRLVVGFGPGGATDTFARIFSVALGKQLNETVIVENVSGASGYIGWTKVATSAPDGYTLMMAENALVIRPSFKDIKPRFDPLAQFTPIAFAATSPLAICVANTIKADNMKQLIALSKASAKKLTFASAGVTSVSQLVWDVVRVGAGINTMDIPYRGGGPAMADLIAGHVDMTLPSSQVAKPLVADKRIKCLAVTGKERSPALPQVPTVDEDGIKHADVDLRFWFSVFGPKGMPDAVTSRLQKAIQDSLKDPELKARLKALDITPDYAGGPELKARVANDIKNWTAFIQSAGLKGQ
ncbi:MAG TPA: tripartite tricarboxylate transporter substrate binding protein [Pseudolabrys sp.]|jgi:tripartite-type tricarboxylate transporter receptor subunit TctC|nr:tripartite tricarboxylate transporter substrate binding protein [Pseudolabrys sp.]